MAKIQPISRAKVLVVVFALCAPALAQNWSSTATKAFPVANGSLIGALEPSTPMHVALGLQMQNTAQVQPTLKKMITPGDPSYGTPLTPSQFVAQFAPSPAQVQSVTTYLSNNCSSKPTEGHRGKTRFWIS